MPDSSLAASAQQRPGGRARAHGLRVPYADVPTPVRAWVEDVLGAPVAEALPRVGGMSPAMAATVVSAAGRRIFVKAVGSSINPDTPTHFRHEIAALRALPPAPYRAGLLAAYDDGDWVGIALDDIAGPHPDWDSAADRELVLQAVLDQTRELTPPPPGVPVQSSSRVFEKYVEALDDPSAEELAALPDWAQRALPRLREVAEHTRDSQRDETFAHWDVRHDNILIRAADRQPLLLDWGMARLGDRWSDTVVFALEWVNSAYFDEVVARLDLSAAEDRAITGFLAGAGVFMAMSSTHPAPPALPRLPAFRGRVGLACLEGVRRRLALSG